MSKFKLLIAGVVVALVSLGGVSTAQAAGKVAVDLPNEAVAGGTSVAVPVTLSDFTGSDLTVRVVAGTGTLSIANNSALTLNPGYPSFDAQSEISFHGVTADVVSALATNVSWTAPGDAASSSLLLMRVEVTDYVSGTTYDPLTGHTYEYVSTPLAWHDALVAAKGMTYQGKPGYLATITSAEENDFIGTKSGAPNIWFGATDVKGFVNEARAAVNKAPIDFDSQPTGDYYWAGGPDIGTQFGVGLGTVTPVDGLYNSWSGGEPNNWSGEEGCAVTNWNSVGLWNDLDCNGQHSYLVEFSTDLTIFENSVFTFDNITGDSKDAVPAEPVVEEPEVPVVEPVAEPTLAETGYNAWLIASLAIVLVGAGAGLRIAARRK
jgi:hypothetical protein